MLAVLHMADWWRFRLRSTRWCGVLPVRGTTGVRVYRELTTLSSMDGQYRGLPL